MWPLALVAGWAFAEATLFFIVADVPIMAIGIRYGWRRALAAAGVAALFAAVGGLVVMEWAAAAPGASRAMMEHLPGIDAALFDEAAAAWREGGFVAMAQAAFRGEPYKLYAHAAGGAGSGLVGFFLASLIARLPRFVLLAVVGSVIGPPLRRRLPPRTLGLLFVLAWTVFYAAYFALMA